MSQVDFKVKKREIVARLNIQQEFEELSVRTVGTPNAKGWLRCHSPYRNDETPSCGINVGSGKERGYLCDFGFFATASPEQRNWAHHSLFDVAVNTGKFFDFSEALRYYAKKTGVQLSNKKPLSKDMVEKYQKNLTPEVVEYLKVKRGLNEESIKKYEIGWCLDKGYKERNTFPVYDENRKFVNIRFHNSKKKPKTLNYSGYGTKRLWGVDRLTKLKPGYTVCITEGEWDAMLLEQETGLYAVSPTNGKGAFELSWVNCFKGHNVVIVWDCDLEGRNAVQRTILPLFKKAVQSQEIPSIKVIWLYDEISKTEKDFTDFIVKSGGTGQQLVDMINKTPPHVYQELDTKLPKPVGLSSFIEVDNSKHAGQRITVPLYVYGENSEAYHAVTKVNVNFCPLLKKSECTGRKGFDGACLEDIHVPFGHRVYLSAVAFSDQQLKGALRDFVCDQDKKPSLTWEDNDRLTIREIFAHQVIQPGSTIEVNELIEKPVYVIGGDLVPIGRYKATGFLRSHPRNQKPTILIDTLEKQDEDWQSFDIEKARPLLDTVRKYSPLDIIHDLAVNVTRIYEREDLHLGVLLTLCSPRWFNMPGEGRIRGWISSVVIGDTGTGKTTATEKIFNHANVGYRVSGMTSSRTGITYSCDFDERRGWRIKAGALLKMSRQAIIIDEAQDLAMTDLKTMAEALDTGILKVDRIQNKTFESQTRCVFSCNPKPQIASAEQKTMDSFRWGCQAIQGIFPKMMIRRIDLVLFATSYDIEDKNKVFFPGKNNTPKKITSNHLKALIHFAWNLKEDQIYIAEEIADKIRHTSHKLAKKFGGCHDLPIVYPEDFRKTFARLCVAYAVLDLSTEDYQTIIVKDEHVELMRQFIEAIYGADNCNLDRYAKLYVEQHGLDDPETLAKEIVRIIRTEQGGERLKDILNELSKLEPKGKIKLTQKHLSDSLSVDRKTIQRDIKPLVKNNLVESVRGYLPTTKLFRLLNYLDREYPEILQDDDDMGHVT